MVHGRDHRLDCLGISEGQNRNLYALQELFHNNVVAAGAECLVLHDGLDCVLSFGKVLGDDDTLAQGQTVRLDDNGVFVHLLDVGNCRMGIVKSLIAGSGNAVLLHQILGKDLAALEDCRIGTGAEGGNASLVKRIHHAQYQRVIRRNYDKVDSVILGEAHNTVDISGTALHTDGICRNTAVARQSIDRFRLGALLERPDNGMFPSAGTNYQNFHQT